MGKTQNTDPQCHMRKNIIDLGKNTGGFSPCGKITTVWGRRSARTNKNGAVHLKPDQAKQNRFGHRIVTGACFELDFGAKYVLFKGFLRDF